MIKRFYVDNYKCLVNFEYKPNAFELIVGSNGAGKSTVYEALLGIQDFILNHKTLGEVFPPKTMTRWQAREEMNFELEIQYEENSYAYELVLHINEAFCSIKSEVLWRNKEKIIDAVYKSEVIEDQEIGTEVTQFLEVNRQANGRTWNFRVSADTKSVISSYLPEFRKVLQTIILLRMQPALMVSSVQISSQRPSSSFSNFPDYYLHLLQEKQSLIFDLLPILRENIEGFRSFVLEERGPEIRHLRVEFLVEGGKKGQTVRYDFSELSDGQRALIALYTLAFCEAGSTLLIDEPENYISLRELQPWLMLLKERIEDFGGQAIMISHHPEFINIMAPQDAVQFRRRNGGPVTIRPFETEQFEGLTPAEIVARGWENE